MAEKEKGFSLIELLVVIAVVGVLTGAVIAVLNPVKFFAEARDGRRMGDLTTIQSALEQYFSQNNAYPASPLPAAGSALTDGSVTYLKSIPGDPSGGDYSYAVSVLNFEICAAMETSPLPDACLSPAYGASGDCCLTNPF